MRSGVVKGRAKRIGCSSEPLPKGTNICAARLTSKVPSGRGVNSAQVEPPLGCPGKVSSVDWIGAGSQGLSFSSDHSAVFMFWRL